MPENKAKFNKCLKELGLTPFLGSCLWFPEGFPTPGWSLVSVLLVSNWSNSSGAKPHSSSAKDRTADLEPQQ